MGDTMTVLVDPVCLHSLKTSQDEEKVMIVAMERLARHLAQAG